MRKNKQLKLITTFQIILVAAGVFGTISSTETLVSRRYQVGQFPADDTELEEWLQEHGELRESKTSREESFLKISGVPVKGMGFAKVPFEELGYGQTYLTFSSYESWISWWPLVVSAILFVALIFLRNLNVNENLPQEPPEPDTLDQPDT